jgi:NRAMP (natural resistance-associated macrophage protein)-like metal ion transporter
MARRGWRPRAALRELDLAVVRASREARKGFHSLGPGLITGVADDDPSGISTYTVTGAVHGYRLLWMSLVTLPMNFAVQTICARIGLVTGHGLAENISDRWGRGWLYPVVALLVLANVVNIGADIGAIAAAIELVTGAPSLAFVVPVGLGIALVEVVVPYARFARVLKLLTLVIFAYVAGAFVAGVDWGEALRGTVVPTFTMDRGTIAAVVAILGTTISPYLFFWQVSEEVEEEHAHGIRPAEVTRSRLRELVDAAGIDVGLGMILANVGFYFVVLTSAATLHASGMTDLQTASQAAEALRPLAGDAASLLFALGIIGTGLLAVPVLAGSAGYAVAELFEWPEGLDEPLKRAPQFYGVIALATVVGVGIVLSPLSEIRALFFAAVLNGVVAPVMLVFVMLTAHDRGRLGEFVPGRGLLATGWFTTIAMALAALALFASLI